MRILDAIELSGFARKTAASASDFAGVVQDLIKDVRESYRPKLQYRRGPGPRWRATHQSSFGVGSENPGTSGASGRSVAKDEDK